MLVANAATGRTAAIPHELAARVDCEAQPMYRLPKRVVVEERTRDRLHGGAAHDGEARGRRELERRLADRDAVDQALRVLLGRGDRRAAAVGHRRGDHDRVRRA